MNNPEAQLPADETSGEAQNLSEEKRLFLEKLVKEKDTDENIEKLGKALSKDWQEKPDLSFENFEEKRLKKDQ